MGNHTEGNTVILSPPIGHKLCGYLITLLRLTPPLPVDCPLRVGTPLALFSHGASVFGFRSQFDHILSPLANKHRALAANHSSSPKKGKKKFNAINNTKKRKVVGGGVAVNALSNTSDGVSAGGSGRGGGVGGVCVPSVVHQIKTLVNQRSLRIVATVVGVLRVNEDEEETRVVVLVDVYLPEAVWANNWQFPRSNSTVAALFRHLSCDWKERDAIFENGYCKDAVENARLLTLPDCHVFGCKQHSNIFKSSKTKGFELHEIFKRLPSLAAQIKTATSSIAPYAVTTGSGIWDLTDDILINILSILCPMDLQRVSVTCHHLRFLSASILPCIKLKLFPHQQAAVEWMVQRERNAAVLNHPLYLDFVTKDGFSFCINIASGELVAGSSPTIWDFRGGMFCDEPGLGKTITALSLILKTQGTLADPPEGTEVILCSDGGYKKCGLYECTGSRYSDLVVPSPGQKSENQNDRRALFSPDELIPEDHLTPKKPRFSIPGGEGASSMHSCPKSLTPASPEGSHSGSGVVRFSRRLNHVKRNLFSKVEDTSISSKGLNMGRSSGKRKRTSNDLTQLGTSSEYASVSKGQMKDLQDDSVEDWVTCDHCGKWRRVPAVNVPDPQALWFCCLNPDPDYQSCFVPEETTKQPLTYLHGFCSQQSSGGLPENVAFFVSVLKEHSALLNGHTKKALRWLARLPALKLLEMENVGLVRPGQLTTKEANSYRRIFEAFGLIMKKEKGTIRWFYPKSLINLVFDLPALRTALCEPLDSYKMYLSRATLIVVPSNLVDHWRTQIEKHVRPDQLKVYVWTDFRSHSVHNLAWDYDVVITTFSRLSAEWNPRRVSILMQVHWMRVMLDEGHTLGSSMNLSNKMQLAVSLRATNRWILTGTPTPNTPSSQVSHLQPMLKFLHDEVYGKSPKNWEAGILRPFEAEMEEGQLRLLALLKRCMISARKSDLRCIPPCIKKTTLVEFTKEHAKTYNELVVTVRRNILMADWEDPNHIESLLNPKQWKFRTNTIKNVRLSCCVAGHIKVSEAGQDIQETMDDLVKTGLDPLSVEYAIIKYHISYGGDCQRCGEWCRLPIITPCRHILCLDCVATDSEKCPLNDCNFQYEMQSPDIKRSENPNPQRPVPKDLIELQPSYKQDCWDPDWQSTSSSKVAYLVQRLQYIQAVNRQIDCSMNEDNPAERPCVSDSCLQPWRKLSGDSCKATVEKVLVFSQFLEHIHVIVQQLTIAGIKFTGMYSPMNAGNKKKALAVFQRDPNCLVLVMDGTAALGLDLSFVTHVFLMEPIWDRSMEEQVISRAHRMGAVRPIQVETLAMRGTIEEQMLKFIENPDKYRSLVNEDHDNTSHEGARAHRSLHDFAEREYLTLLRMVRPGK